MMERESKLLWKPGDISSTRIEKFRLLINEKYSVTLKDYHDLYKWSVENIESFWSEVWTFCGVISSQKFNSVLQSDKSMEEIPAWFEGAKLNYAENLLERGNGDDIAVIFANEKKVNNSLTYSQLKDNVKAFASSLTALGVGVGDRVVGLLPNNEIALYGYLASASIGAIWSCTSTDFGSASVLERFKQIDPKLLLAVDTAVFNGKIFSQVSKIEEIMCELGHLKAAIICQGMSSESNNNSNSGNIEEKTRILLQKYPTSSYTLKDFLSLGVQNGTTPGGKLTYAQVPFSHPLCILYSSGTTGAPKCMVHSHGGTLIEHMKEHLIHGQVNREDVFMYYTTTGWMMYNWLVSSLVSGCTIVLYDGAAIINRLWDLVDEIKITIFGTSAKWIATNEIQGFKPMESHRLTSLRAILSTGSPLSPHSFKYIYNWVKKDLLLGSITGGSDIISCFAHHTVTLPVYEGEIQSRGLGMAVECYSDDGERLYDEEGELVCTKAFPCMPVFFWNDENGAKYHKAYFAKFKGIWCHGDYCIINGTTGGIVMLGRSDGTLNPNGIRFGSSEIYNIVQTFPQIADSVCVGQSNSDKSEERVVLFVKMKNGCDFDSNLLALVSTAIREQLSPRHVPAVILPIGDIPYTINGKKVEMAVKTVIHGKVVSNIGCIVNPESLDLFKGIPQLEGF